VCTGLRVLDQKKELETIKETFRTIHSVQWVIPIGIATPLTPNQVELMRRHPATAALPNPMASNSAAAGTTSSAPSAVLLEAQVREFLLTRFGSGVLRDVSRAALHFITHVLVSTGLNWLNRHRIPSADETGCRLRRCNVTRSFVIQAYVLYDNPLKANCSWETSPCLQTWSPI
jgi:hypothetical protein